MSTIYSNKKQLINTLIRESDVVLDLGFWGQGVMMHHDNWVHRLLLNRAKEVYGLDVEFDPSQVAKLPHPERYKKSTAEDFDFDVKFDVILVADLIEHLSNLGSFLDSCARNLKANGRIVITTPNCFNLFNMASKLTKVEPIMNKDETVYFNHRALRQLLGKHGWKVEEAGYLYSLGVAYRESYRKKFLNAPTICCRNSRRSLWRQLWLLRKGPSFKPDQKELCHSCRLSGALFSCFGMFCQEKDFRRILTFL